MLAHLLDQAAFRVRDLVVRQRADPALGVQLPARQLAVAAGPACRSQLQVGQGVIHPSHVPLEVEAQAPMMVGLLPRHAAPRVRLLGNGHHPRVPLVHHPVQVAQEGNGLQVRIASVLILDPLSLPFEALRGAEVAVQHRGHGVKTEAIHVVALRPEEHRPEEKAPHLVLPEVEDLRPPVLLLALSRVLVLERGGAVEGGEAASILAEVGRNEVHNHPNAAAV
mmetsp:Transcript_28545/g.94728  ORF Transcript_28545/g.94728 Transcript_28545/m.94728 type:complete len:223 (-) Transcript_28545:1270-1938(-)